MGTPSGKPPVYGVGLGGPFAVIGGISPAPKGFLLRRARFLPDCALGAFFLAALQGKADDEMIRAQE
jgi:hypothetical protein